MENNETKQLLLLKNEVYTFPLLWSKNFTKRTLMTSVISRVFCRFIPRFWVMTPVFELISKNEVQSPSRNPNPVAESN